MKKLIVTIALVGFCAGCGTAKVAGHKEISTAPKEKPGMIYVADFELDAANIKAEKGLLTAPGKLPGPFGNILPPPPGAPKDPKILARDLVDSMATSIVKGLAKSELNARRLAPGEPMPT